MRQRSFWIAAGFVLSGVGLHPLFSTGAPSASREKVIHSFTSGTDGANPQSDLVLDGAGNVYGTTYLGGSGTACGNQGCGTVFELERTKNGWKERVVYSFTGGADAELPAAGLAFDSVGNLYGTTVAGANSYGTVFKLTPKSGGGWTERVIYTFPFNGSAGISPASDLALDSKGNLYGTTSNGGNYGNCQLGSGLEKSLAAYAGAALAAGVSLLAMTERAECRIIYTPAHTSIPINDKEPVFLDLNHDGIADFSFWNLGNDFSEGEFDRSLLFGCAAAASHQSVCRNKQNQIWGKGGFASALRPGFKVGPSKSYFHPGQRFQGSYGWRPGTLMARYGGQSPSGASQNWTSGQWLYTKQRDLGLQFMIDGQVHYGWARVAVTLNQQGVAATLTGYAYETVPDKPIVTGKTKGPDVITLEPTSLGRLAQGASGVSAWREKNSGFLPSFSCRLF